MRGNSECSLIRLKTSGSLPWWQILEKMKQTSFLISAGAVEKSCTRLFISDWFLMSASTCILVPAATFERSQHVSRTTAVFWCNNNFSSLGRTKSLCKRTSVCWALPVEMFPKVLRAGTTIYTLFSSNNFARNGTTPLLTTVSICSCLSEWDVMPQQQSASTVLSLIVPSTMNPHRTGIASATNLNYGNGFDLQRLESAQAQFFIRFGFSFLLAILMRLVIPPALIMASLYLVQSEAMFPIPHIACSTISLSGWPSMLTKMGITPRSTMTLHWGVVPAATLVKIHAASRCSCG